MSASSDSSYSLPRSRPISLYNLGTVGSSSRISCNSSRMTTGSLPLPVLIEVPLEGGVTTNTEFDRATDRKLYVLSLVQITASSFGCPLIVNLRTDGQMKDCHKSEQSELGLRDGCRTLGCCLDQLCKLRWEF